jgi:hypothetical protein
MFGLVSGGGVGYDPLSSEYLEPRMIVRLSTLLLAAAPLASFGCSDPPPTPARAALEVQLNPPATTIQNIGTRTSCTAGTTGTYTYFLGKTSSLLSRQDRVRNGLIEHGQGGFSASCTVKALGGGRYSVNASLSGVDSNNRHVATALTLNGTLSATAAPADNIGQVAFYSPDTTNLRNVADLPECEIGPVHVVKDGALFADFHCRVLADSTDTVKGCEVTGTIAVERCRTGKEDD